MFLASGDTNADGRDDIIVSLDSGGRPRMKVFSGVDGAVLRDPDSSLSIGLAALTSRRGTSQIAQTVPSAFIRRGAGGPNDMNPVLGGESVGVSMLGRGRLIPPDYGADIDRLIQAIGK